MPDIVCTQVSATDVSEGDPVTVTVELEREWEEDSVPPVDAPLFPGKKDEGWWLVVGEPSTNQLLAIKRVSLGTKARSSLKFAAPGAL